MHLKPKHLNIILNIFLGVAWAIAFYSLIYGFTFSHGNILIRLISAIIHFIFGLIAVVVVEMIFAFFKNIEIQEENNKLLKELLERENS